MGPWEEISIYRGGAAHSSVHWLPCIESTTTRSISFFQRKAIFVRLIAKTLLFNDAKHMLIITDKRNHH